jgi:hypothetical protein
VLLGVPLAALLHSMVQFAYDASTTLGDAGVFVFQVVLGILFGSVVLIPAYTVQALLFRWLWARGAGLAALAAVCGALQAIFVCVWWLVVGLQPSLGGRFRMGPVMVAAAFVAGALVALGVAARLREGPATAPAHASES